MSAQSGEASLLDKALEIIDEEICNKYGFLTRKDIIKYNAFVRIRDIFQGSIDFSQKISTEIFGKQINSIVICGCINVSMEWYSLNLYDDLHAPGSWGYQGVNGYPVLGDDVISLFTHLRSSD